jgi:hypothetical protein
MRNSGSRAEALTPPLSQREREEDSRMPRDYVIRLECATQEGLGFWHYPNRGASGGGGLMKLWNSPDFLPFSGVATGNAVE